MNFTKKTLSLNKIEDTVFTVVKMAKEDIAKNGPDMVVNATIGSLCDEDGKLVTYDSVFNSYNNLPNQIKATYAQSFRGNDNYIDTVNQWIFKDIDFNLNYKTVASVGGTGAVSLSLLNLIDEGQSIIAPNVAWGTYKLMTEQFNLGYETYNIIKNDEFDLEDFKRICLKVKATQDKLLIIINDPCHNPTGLSMGLSMWQQVITFLNTLAKELPVIIINDIAYIDYAFDQAHSRDYLLALNDAHPNIMTIIAFSTSKTFTSYGLRCGAAIIAAKNEADVDDVYTVFEKSCRALWSNIPNAAMENFANVIANNLKEYLKEKQFYIDLLQKRSDLFLAEAKENNLKIYQYDEGFFITLVTDNNTIRDVWHQALIDDHIYTVKVNLGIRIAICSLSLEKTKGLGRRIKNCLKV